MNSPFVPNNLPIENLDFARLITPVSRASAALAAYDARLRQLDNPTLMLAPLATQEAVLSSRIEGTIATLVDVLGFEAGQSATGEIANDIQEILNYRRALEFGSESIMEMHLSRWLVRQLHQALLDSVRGRDKTPGQWRNREVIIAPAGSRDRNDALYIPPAHELIDEYMSNWEQFLGLKEQEPLIQTAIMHAQFEIIHPFLDGNGRIGRLLIPLFLFQRGLLHLPMFYISGYLEQNRDAYYLFLRRITDNGDWNGWIEFFLHAIQSKAQEDYETVSQIDALRERTYESVALITKGRQSRELVRALFTKPIFQAKDFQLLTGINKDTIKTHLRHLKNAGLVTVVQPALGPHPETLSFAELVSLISGVR